MILVMLGTLLISHAIASDRVLLETVEAILQSTIQSNDTILTVDVDFDIGYPRWNYRLQPSLERECVKIKPTYSILNIEDDVKATSKIMFMSCLLNPKGKFMLLVQNKQTLETIFETLLEYFIDRVIVLVKSNERCILYSYKKVTNGLEIYRIGSYKEGKLLLRENAFKTKLSPDSFKSMQALTLYYPPYVKDEKNGITPEILQFIGSRLNVAVNLTISTPKYFSTISDGNNFSGMYLDLAKRDYECYAGLDTPPDKTPYYFDLTVPIVEDRASVVVPLMEERSFVRIFVGEYSLSTWIYYITTFFIMPSSLPRFFQKLEKRNFGWVQVLQMNLDMPINLKVTANSPRFAFMAHVIAVLVLNTIYRSKLYTLITDDRPRLKLRTINDILDAKLKVGLYNSAFDQFHLTEEESQFYESVKEDIIICDTSDYCVNRTAFQKDIFTVKLSRRMDYLIPLFYLDEKGKPLVQVIESFGGMLVQYPVVFLKGHPLFERFNGFLMAMKENGFMDLHYKKVERDSKKATQLVQSSNMRAYPLNVDHFKCIFLAYGVAIAISVTVFVLEVLKGYK